MSYKLDWKRELTPGERAYEFWNRLAFVLVATVIVCYSDTGLEKIEFLMSPWLPLLTAVILAIRLPFRWVLAPELRGSTILHWIGIATGSVMLFIAWNLKK